MVVGSVDPSPPVWRTGGVSGFRGEGQVLGGAVPLPLAVVCFRTKQIPPSAVSCCQVGPRRTHQLLLHGKQCLEGAGLGLFGFLFEFGWGFFWGGAVYQNC